MRLKSSQGEDRNQCPTQQFPCTLHTLLRETSQRKGLNEKVLGGKVSRRLDPGLPPSFPFRTQRTSPSLFSELIPRTIIPHMYICS